MSHFFDSHAHAGYRVHFIRSEGKASFQREQQRVSNLIGTIYVKLRGKFPKRSSRMPSRMITNVSKAIKTE